MKLALVAVKDKKAEGFLPIYTERNPAIAIRNFVEQVQSKGTQFNKFPEDYELYLMGEYDPETGIINAYNTTIIGNDNKEIKTNNAKLLCEAKNFITEETNG